MNCVGQFATEHVYNCGHYEILPDAPLIFVVLVI